jgi:DEAD/DEAH box helicase domain-containing protein
MSATSNSAGLKANLGKRKRKLSHAIAVESSPISDGDNIDRDSQPAAGEECIASSSPPTATSTAPSPPKPLEQQKQKKKRTRVTKQQPKRDPSSITTPSWPPALSRLERTHRALNLVSTFLSARRHVAPTLETLRPAVERHTGCALLVEDVAAIVALLLGEGGAGAGTVRFEFVERAVLEASLGGAADHGVPWEGGKGQGEGEGEGEGEEEQVLVLEFLDGELKSEGTAKSKSKSKDREERMKMPVFSQAQMTRLIERRNAKFAQAVDAFVARCVGEGLDPEMVLLSERERYIPRPRTTQIVQEGKKLSDTLPETIPRERKSIREIVREIKESPWYTGQIVPDGHRVFEPQEAVYGDLNFLLSQDLVNALYNARGITRFYAHQAEAINALHEGYHVVVATSTSSGKSLIYQLPVLHALEQDHNTRAMYIFPTKALAQDQRRSLREMMGFMPGLEDVLVETFDGDTPMKERNAIRDEARIIFTNPDMLHITILPQEERWRTFLKNLKYVVGKGLPSKNVVWCGFSFLEERLEN